MIDEANDTNDASNTGDQGSGSSDKATVAIKTTPVTRATLPSAHMRRGYAH